MKLMVAGCSYSAISDTHPGTAWSEVLAKKLGWDLINLARQGASNGGIRLMIDEIISQRPDFAIVAPTFPDRTEIPVDPMQFDRNGADFALEDHLRKHNINGYDPLLGVMNINYGYNTPRLISETIYSLAENHDHKYRPKLRKETHHAVKQWVNYIYDSRWKKQLDEWIITQGLMMMYHEGIKFLVVPNFLWAFDPERSWRENIPRVVPDHYIMLDDRESPQSITGNYPPGRWDPGYHGSVKSQIIIAENWYRRISRDFGLA